MITGGWNEGYSRIVCDNTPYKFPPWQQDNSQFKYFDVYCDLGLELMYDPVFIHLWISTPFNFHKYGYIIDAQFTLDKCNVINGIWQRGFRERK